MLTEMERRTTRGVGKRHNYTLSKDMEKQVKFNQKLFNYLREKYSGENLHVWVNSKAYMGLYIWGLASHWKWGDSGVTHEETKAISQTARAINVKVYFKTITD